MNLLATSFFRISSRFGRRQAPTRGASSFHKGVDIAAKEGTPVLAAMNGVVTKCEKQRGYGNVVYIQHADGTETRYAHLNGFADFRPGMPVSAGMTIGYVGSTGVSTGSHLHFEVRNSAGEAVDPQQVFGEYLDQFHSMPSMPGFDSGAVNRQILAGATPSADSLPDLNADNEDVIMFSYKKRKEFMSPQEQAQTAQTTPAAQSPFGLFLEKLLPGYFSSKKQKSSQAIAEETMTDFVNRPTVQLKLSKNDMKKVGFTDTEISTLVGFISFKERNAGLSETLRLCGQAITPEELQELNIAPEKIEMFNYLAEQQFARQSV